MVLLMISACLTASFNFFLSQEFETFDHMVKRKKLNFVIFIKNR